MKAFKLEIGKSFWEDVLTPIEIGYKRGYTLSQTRQLVDSANMLSAHVLILWDLKQKLLNSPKQYPGMLKLHLIQHLAESSTIWGTASKGNTETLEHLSNNSS